MILAWTLTTQVTAAGVTCDAFTTLDAGVSSGAFACARMDPLTDTLLVR